MLIRELVSILQEYTPDYSRQSLVDIINYVQREVFASRLDYNRAVDPLTGLDYEIEVVALVHTIADAQAIGFLYTNDETIWTERRVVGNTIYFQDGDIGSKFYVRYYLKRPTYTVETQTLVIPDELVSMFEDGCVARMQFKQHGLIDPWIMWKKTELSNLRRMLNNNYRWKR